MPVRIIEVQTEQPFAVVCLAVLVARCAAERYPRGNQTPLHRAELVRRDPKSVMMVLGDLAFLEVEGEARAQRYRRVISPGALIEDAKDLRVPLRRRDLVSSRHAHVIQHHRHLLPSL